MPAPDNSMKKYYENITKITGIDFGTGSVGDINRALSHIYIDGHNLFDGYAETIMGAEHSNVRRISELLDQVVSSTDDTYSFISIMNPNDPYAVPRMINTDTLLDTEGKVLDPAAMKEAETARINDIRAKKKAAAENFSKTYSARRNQSLEALNQELKAGVPAPENYHNISNIFGPEVYDEKTRTVTKQNLFVGMDKDLDAVMDMCNLVLLGRGFTQEELSGNDVNVQEGREKLKKSVQTLLFDTSLDTARRETAFNRLADDAIRGLESLHFKPVDLSDDRTYENVKYNRQIANMASGLRRMCESARKTIGYGRVDEIVDRIHAITNYTDGIMALDTVRINSALNGASKSAVERGLTAQVYVDSMGQDYVKFHTDSIGAAKHDMSVMKAVQHAADSYTSTTRSRTEFEAAYNGLKKSHDSTAYKNLAASYIDYYDDLKKDLQHMQQISAGKVPAQPGKSDFWFTPAQDLTFNDYRDFIKSCFGTSVNQLDRVCTVGTLAAMYGAWEAEREDREFSVKDYIKNRGQQREMGTKMLDFFEKHPIPAGTQEATEENVRLYGEMAASFNRRLDEVEIPNVKPGTPEECAQQFEYVNALSTIVQDSLQLRDLVPKDDQKLVDIFYQAEGGFEKYSETSACRDLGLSVLRAEKEYLKSYSALDHTSQDYMFTPSQDFNMTNLVVDTYLLNHDCKKFMGKKMSDCPSDPQYITFMNSAASTGLSGSMDVRKLVKKDRIKRQQVVDYVKSFGKDDKLNLNASMTAGREASMEAFGVAPENREDYREEFEILEKPEEVFVAADESQEVSQEVREFSVGERHDWTREMSRKDWRDRIGLMEKMMSDNDSAMIHSSPEYKAVREGLKEAKAALDAEFKEGEFDPCVFNTAMDKVFQNAGDYIQKKENSAKIGKKYGQRRLDAMRDLRGMLGKRNSKAMNIEGLTILFGDRDTLLTQEGCEKSFMRLGSYLRKADDLKKTDPAESKRMIDLVDRVLEERGKNQQTRMQLQSEMDRSYEKYSAPNTISLEEGQTMDLCKAKDAIFKVMSEKGSMTEKAANWFTVMDGYVKMAQGCDYDKVHDIAAKENVREVAMCGRLAERTMQTRYRAMDIDAPEQLTQKEAAELVTFSALGEFMKYRNSSAHKGVFKSIMKNHGSEDELLKDFENLEAVQHLCERTGKENVRHLASGHTQEMLGALGKQQFCEKLAGELPKQPKVQELQLNQQMNKQNEAKVLHQPKNQGAMGAH